MESKKEEEEYSFSYDNLKFPTFYGKTLNECFKNEKMSKEVLIQDISKILNYIQSIIDLLTDMIKNNINNFVTISLSYNINIFDYLIIFILIKDFMLIIQHKIENNTNQIKIPTFDDFFNNENYKNIIEMEYKNSDKNYENIKEIINKYANDMKDILETNHEYGINFMCYIFKYFYSLLERGKNQLDLYYKVKYVNKEIDIKLYHKNMIVYFDLISTLKIFEHVNMLLHNSYMVDKNDLYNYEEDSDDWKDIKKIMCRVNTKKKDEIEDLSIKGSKDLIKMSVFFNKAVNFDSYVITNLFKAAGFALKYKINSDENLMEFESKESLLNTKELMIYSIIHLSDIPLFKKIRERSYPKIAFREKIYMRKDYTDISLEYIKQLLVKIYGNEITKNFGDSKQKERIILDENKKKNFPLWAQKLKKEDKPYYVSTRLLNSYNFKNFGMKKIKKSFFGLIETINENIKAESTKAIILFIHGGGFLRFKNFLHENYLRELVNKLNIPLLGIDYRSAPEYPYPEGLNDCFQMYMWVLEHCENELGFKPEKIILAGDSSGGNLALALIYLIISLNEYENKNIRIPDFLFLLYPCCHTGIKNMTLSLTTSFEPNILTMKELYYINKVYRGYYPNEIDPFLNPLTITENILKKLPPTRLMTATHDPLRDDIIRLLRKISKIPGMDVKNYEFTNYEHGFIGNEDNMISGPSKEIFCKEIKEFLEKK